MRTQKEIFERYNVATGRDPLGFESSEYLYAMTFETAKPILKDDAAPDKWLTPDDSDRTDQKAKEYMGFWLEKIEGQRGISVCRATQHYTAWKWLLGHPDADTFPGSFGASDDGGEYQRDAYSYIENQIKSGEWDRMTREANPGIESRSTLETV